MSAAASSSAAAAEGPANMLEYTRPPLGSIDVREGSLDGYGAILALWVDIMREMGHVPALLPAFETVTHARDDIDALRPRIVRVQNPDFQAGLNKQTLLHTLNQYLISDLCVMTDTARIYKYGARDLILHHAKQHGSIATISNNQFREYRGDWDITVPTKVWARETLQNPPALSILSIPDVRTLLAAWERVTPNAAFVLGPDAKTRRSMWRNGPVLAVDIARMEGYIMPSEVELKETALRAMRAKLTQSEANRRRLATHLSKLPGVIMDMANDPMCPWKGMKFFHGTPSATLQVETEENKGKHAPYYPCNLSWGQYIGTDGRTYEGSAFLSPYYTKGFSYGGATPHIYTYTLRDDGKTLRFLDLRNDYNEHTHRHPVLDPYAPIWELAGIPHGGIVRDDKARDLYELFKDSGIDGCVMNADVEWVFFHPSSLLDWIPRTPGILMPPLDLVHTLRNANSYTLATLALELTEHTAITTEEIKSFLTGPTALKRKVALSSLPITRWTMDTSHPPYMSQYVTTTADPSSNLWTSIQEPAHTDVVLTVYECMYEDLWDFFDPGGALNIWMADAITEGSNSGISRKTPLIYHQLVKCLLSMGGPRTVAPVLLVHLPNGFTQLVPPMTTSALDHRMYFVRPARAPKTTASVDQGDMPRRSFLEPQLKRLTLAAPAAAAAAASSSGSKRKVDEEEDATKKARMQGSGGKQQHVPTLLGGSLGKPCIC